MNTSTFGEDCQRQIIYPIDDSNIIGAKKGGEKLYKVMAIVGEQDHPLDYHERDVWTRGVCVGRHHRSRTLLGYISEEVILEKFPNTCNFFSIKRKVNGDSEDLPF